MSLDTYQRSTQLSNVVELYEWTAARNLANGTQNDRIWRYTSADRIISFQSDNWLRAAFRRSTLHRGSGETASSELVVTAPRDMDFIREFFEAEGTPSSPLSLRMIRFEPGQTGYAIPFVGDALYGTFERDEVHITLMTPEARMQRRIPRVMNQPRCNWFTYDVACGKNPVDFMYEGPVTAIDGRVVTVTGAEAAKGGDIGYFTNGSLIAPGGERAIIEGTVGDDIILMHALSVLEVGDDVNLLAGDDFTLATCYARFANALRFSGTTVKQPKINPYVSGIR